MRHGASSQVDVRHVADRMPEDATAEAAELLHVGPRREELVAWDVAGRGEGLAAGQDLGHVARRFARRRDERHVPPHDSADQCLQQREVRAAQHQRVDVAAPQGFQVLAGDLLEDVYKRQML